MSTFNAALLEGVNARDVTIKDNQLTAIGQLNVGINFLDPQLRENTYVSNEQQTEIERKLQYCLKLRYSDYKLERIFDSESSSIKKGYTDLVLFKLNKKAEAEAETKADGLPSPNEELINLNELFNEITDTVNRKSSCKILLFGEPGTGKTVFCYYLVNQWLKNIYPKRRIPSSVDNKKELSIDTFGKSLASKFKLVFLLNTRSIENHMENTQHNLVDILDYFCLGGRKSEKPSFDAFESYIDKHSNEILFILDDCEQLSVAANRGNKTIQILIKELISHACVLFVSRSRQVTRFGAHPIHFNIKVENNGYNEENVEKYVVNFFSSKGQRSRIKLFLEFLRNYAWDIAHNPMNLEMICWLGCQKHGFFEASEAVTATQLYSTMVDRIEYTKSQDYPGLMKPLAVVSHCSKLSNLPLPIELAKNYLSNLAYELTVQQKLVIDSNIIKKVINKLLCENNVVINKVHQTFRTQLIEEFHELILNLGWIKNFDIKQGAGRLLQDQAYCFTHDSFKDYFCARYIIDSFSSDNNNKKNVLNFLKTNKYLFNCEHVIWFAAGLIYNNYDTNTDILNVNFIEFWNAIQSAPIDMLGVRHLFLCIGILNEWSYDKRVPGIDNIIEKMRFYVNRKLYGTRCINPDTSIFQYIKRFNPTHFIEIFNPLFLEAMCVENWRVKLNAIEILCDMSFYNEDIISQLRKLLKDPHAKVRENSLVALTLANVRTDSDIETYERVENSFKSQSENEDFFSLTAWGQASEASRNALLGALGSSLFTDISISLRPVMKKMKQECYDAASSAVEKVVWPANFEVAYNFYKPSADNVEVKTEAKRAFKLHQELSSLTVKDLIKRVMDTYEKIKSPFILFANEFKTTFKIAYQAYRSEVDASELNLLTEKKYQEHIDSIKAAFRNSILSNKPNASKVEIDLYVEERLQVYMENYAKDKVSKDCKQLLKYITDKLAQGKVVVLKENDIIIVIENDGYKVSFDLNSQPITLRNLMYQEFSNASDKLFSKNLERGATHSDTRIVDQSEAILKLKKDQNQTVSSKTELFKKLSKDAKRIALKRFFNRNKLNNKDQQDYSVDYSVETMANIFRSSHCNASNILRYVFYDDHYFSKRVSFIEQFSQLIILKNHLNVAAVLFISRELAQFQMPNFIFGLVKQNEVLFISPLGLTKHKGFYTILARLLEKKYVSKVYLSSNKLLNDSNCMLSSGPICVELVSYFSEHMHLISNLTKDYLVDEFEYEYKELKFVKFHVVDVSNILPRSIRNLACQSHSDCILSLKSFRDRHCQQLKNLTLDVSEVFTDENSFIKSFLNLPEQVLMERLLTEHKNILSIQDSIEYTILKKKHCRKKALTQAQSPEKQNFNSLLRSSDEIVNNIKMRFPRLVLSRILGDGNCLFRAVAVFTTDLEKDHSKLRECAVNYLVANIQKVIAYFPNLDESKFRARLTRMRKDGTYGDMFELYALSQDLQRPIAVIHTDKHRANLMFNQQAAGEPIFLLFKFTPDNRAHYDALVKNDPNANGHDILKQVEAENFNRRHTVSLLRPYNWILDEEQILEGDYEIILLQHALFERFKTKVRRKMIAPDVSYKNVLTTTKPRCKKGWQENDIENSQVQLLLEKEKKIDKDQENIQEFYTECLTAKSVSLETSILLDQMQGVGLDDDFFVPSDEDVEVDDNKNGVQNTSYGDEHMPLI